MYCRRKTGTFANFGRIYTIKRVYLGVDKIQIVVIVSIHEHPPGQWAETRVIMFRHAVP